MNLLVFKELFCIGLVLLSLGCQRDAQSLEAIVKSEALPILGCDSYVLTTLSAKRAHTGGAVFTNCTIINNLADMPVKKPNVLLIAHDPLIREMITNEFRLQVTSPGHVNIPLFFIGREDFDIVMLREDGVVTNVLRRRLQSVKIYVKAALRP